MMEQNELHIGHLIKEVFDASGMTIQSFAERLHRERTNVYSIFKRRTMDLELLLKISEVLNHNFLDDVLSSRGMSSSYQSSKINIIIDISQVNNDQWKKIMALIGELKDVASDAGL